MPYTCGGVPADGGPRAWLDGRGGGAPAAPGGFIIVA